MTEERTKELVDRFSAILYQGCHGERGLEECIRTVAAEAQKEVNANHETEVLNLKNALSRARYTHKERLIERYEKRIVAARKEGIEEMEDGLHKEFGIGHYNFIEALAEREKLIGALGDCLGFIDELKDQGIRDWSKEENARAVLAEVKEQR